MTSMICTALCLFCTAPDTDAAEARWAFDDGAQTDWIPGSGEWRVADGALHHPDPFFQGGLAGLPGRIYGDVRVEADVRITKVYHQPDTVWAGILVRASEPLSHGAWHDGYLAILRVNGEVALSRPRETELARADTAARPMEATARLAVEVQGDRLRVLVDGVEALSVEDETFVGGEIAILNYGCDAAFDNVAVLGEASAPQPPAEIAPVHPAPASREPITPPSRIAVRKGPDGVGAFYRVDTGEPFIPRGFDHTVLEERTSGWHATFNTNVYDPEEMESVLAEMAGLGANVVRVWIWGVQNEHGFTGGRESKGLNGAYMENVADFLARAARHGIYVIPILDETPHNAYYDNLSARTAADPSDVRITGYNRQYLSPGPIAAKARGAADFVRWLRETDPGLLATVFAWALANEVNVHHTAGPFALESGKVVIANGKAYDMGDPDQRQACYDDGIVHWAAIISAAIRGEDSDALVTAGMWTSDAHGRPPVNGLMPDDRDPRRPPRPSALAKPESGLDLLDIHIYPWDRTSKVRPEAHEADAVRAEGMPVIVGEYGVFKDKSAEEGRVMLREMLEQAYAMGYQGDLFWAWDLVGVSGQTWGAVEEGMGAYVMSLEPGGAP